MCESLLESPEIMLNFWKRAQAQHSFKSTFCPTLMRRYECKWPAVTLGSVPLLNAYECGTYLVPLAADEDPGWVLNPRVAI